MQLRYTYRIYPTAPQRSTLARTFGCVRTVFNDAIAARRTTHAAGLPFPWTATLDKRLITAAKRTPERSWLAEVSTVPLQQALRDCHAAYKNYFESLAARWNRNPSVDGTRQRAASRELRPEDGKDVKG